MCAVLRLFWRLMRRGIALLGLGIGAYVLVEAVSYVQTYSDQASRLCLADFGDQPAVRMLQGIPHAVETVGGFVVWDGGRAKLTAVGPALDLPGWLIGLSPFYHLALVPVADYALTRGW